MQSTTLLSARNLAPGVHTLEQVLGLGINWEFKKGARVSLGLKGTAAGIITLAVLQISMACTTKPVDYFSIVVVATL